MLRILALSIAMIAFVNSSCNAQAPVEKWETFYWGIQSAQTKIESGIQTSDGGLIFAATNCDDLYPYPAIHVYRYYYSLVKLDACGNILWKRKIERDNIERTPDIIETSNGNYLVSSEAEDSTIENNHDGTDIVLTMIDPNGVILWSKSYGGDKDELTGHIVETGENEFIIAGGSESDDADVSENSGWVDIWVIKVNSNGDLIWEKSFGGSSMDTCTDVILTPNDDILLCGHSKSVNGDVSANFGSSDFWVLKLSTDGELIWEQNFGGSGLDKANALQETSNGDIIVAGFTGSSDGDISSLSGGKDFWVIKIDTDGQLIWEQTFGGTEDDLARDIEIDSDNNIFVGGYSFSNDGDITFNGGLSDGWVIKLSENGELLWEKTIGGHNHDFINKITLIDESSLIVAGLYGAYDDNPDFNLQGGSRGSGWFKMLTKSENTEFDNCVRLSYSHENGIYPNPTTGILNIKEQLPENTSYAVYNSHGQRVLQGTLPGGYAQLDLSALNIGLYIVSVEGLESYKIKKE